MKRSRLLAVLAAFTVLSLAPALQAHPTPAQLEHIAALVEEGKLAEAKIRTETLLEVFPNDPTLAEIQRLLRAKLDAVPQTTGIARDAQAEDEAFIKELQAKDGVLYRDTAPAPSGPRIVVNVVKLFAESPITIAQEAAFKSWSADAKADMARLLAEHSALLPELRALKEKAANPVLSDEARADALKRFQAKIGAARARRKNTGSSGSGPRRNSIGQSTISNWSMPKRSVRWRFRSPKNTMPPSS